MRKMLINASEPEEIRVAVVEGSILEEYYVERMSVESALGNIYKGRVTNVEPSIGAAFVEFGGSRHGFLHVSDIMAGGPLRFDSEPAAGSAECEDASGDGGPPAAADEPRRGRRRSRRSREKGEVVATDDDSDAGGGGGGAPGADPADDSPAGGEREPDRDEGGAVRVETETEVADTEESAAEEEGPEEPAGREERAGRGEPAARGARVDADEDAGDAPQDDASNEVAASVEAEPGTRTGNGRNGKGRHGDGAPKQAPADRRKPRQILDFVEKGQEIVVQVTKDGIGTKGPTLTTYLSLPGRFLVLMPGMSRRGVSRKIDDGKERDRLKKILDKLEAPEDLGFIVRTAGVGQTQRALQKDLDYLTELWEKIAKAARESKAPKLLYRESDLVIRAIRDIYSPDMGDIIIDDEESARRAREFLSVVLPRAQKRVKLYTGERPLFTAYGIEDEIGRLFMHRVELMSGGSLVIEQTEALVAIDVNSGRFREEEDLEETAFKINMEAAEAIARQLRLRDLGGVIVLDFIDMKSEKRRKQVEKAFRAALKNDRARVKVGRMSMFGTIEMTRQRVRPSLRQSIFRRCPACRGVGYVATQETLHLNLVREMRLLLARKNRGIDVWLNQENAEYLFNEKRDRILDLERQTGKRIRVRVEADLRSDEWRVQPFDRP